MSANREEDQRLSYFTSLVALTIAFCKESWEKTYIGVGFRENGRKEIDNYRKLLRRVLLKK